MRIQTAYLHVRPGQNITEDITIFSSNMTDYDYILVGTVEVSIDPNSLADPREAEITILEKKVETMRAEHHQKVTALEERIQSLKAIEYKA